MRTGRLTAAGHNGFLLLKKKSGLTSFESLYLVKKALSSGKVGHTGTLDKFADGLLLVLAGQAGKLAQWFSGASKEYEGTVRFGVETDTLDPEGQISGEGPVPRQEEIEKVLPLFRGEILQAPPVYSALHINGQRAYELARAGKQPEMKKRPVTVYELELLSWAPPFARIRVVCSSGTYIRSLARDIALAAGSRAHLSALTRNKIGKFRLEDAFDPDNGPAELPSVDLVSSLKPVDTGAFKALDLPYRFAGEEALTGMIHGKPLNSLFTGLPDVPVLGVFRVSSAGKEELAAVLEKKHDIWSYGHVFAGR
jgi:tRNA pseudouridine55 synthase